MDRAASRAAGDGSTPPELMGEDELLRRARQAMLRASVLPPGSLGWSVQWVVHDTYMAELRRRALAVVASIGTGEAR
jgi:hypothetical protein